MSDSGYTPSEQEVQDIFCQNDAGQQPHPELLDKWTRFLAAHDAVIREDERKRQAEKDAAIVETYWDREVSPRLFQIARALVKAIRGQSFTGTEGETNA